ncbi:unnamed protein product [Alternaria alternata]
MSTEKVTKSNTTTESIERYSVFTKVEKWSIVALASYAAWFSTLSSFIYFPAIPTLSQDLGVSVNKIDFTVTTYMAVATFSPMLVADTAEILGRRAVYTLTLTIYFVANLAIALSKTYLALVVLRALQALAISGTFSIAYGVVVDIASPAERGSFAALVSFAVTTAPSIGPVLGMLLCLPETSRKIVGNGSIRPTKPLVPPPLIMRHWNASDVELARIWRMPNPLKSLMILKRLDNVVIILACGFLYTVYTCINASLATLFVDLYHLDQLQAGLIYLPFGIGGAASTFVSGRLLDRAWRRARAKRGLSTDRVAGDDLDNFPVERARLQVIWVPMSITAVSVVTYGWVLHYRKVRLFAESGQVID